MDAILGVVRNGRVEVEAPADWPEGSPVRVELGLNGQANCDDEQPETPEEIEDWLRWYHNLEPIEVTPEEEAILIADRKACREWEIANRNEYDKRIGELFE